MRHTTDIQRGDKFVFRGLTGQQMWTGTNLEVLGIEIDGQLAVRASTKPDPQYTGDGEYMHKVPLIDATYMVEQGIWEFVKP